MGMRKVIETMLNGADLFLFFFIVIFKTVSSILSAFTTMERDNVGDL